jgi:hypothetical protein
MMEASFTRLRNGGRPIVDHRSGNPYWSEDMLLGESTSREAESIEPKRSTQMRSISVIYDSFDKATSKLWWECHFAVMKP